MLRYVPSIHNYFHIFFMKGSFITYLLASIQMIICFLSHILLMWYITFIDLCILNLLAFLK
jgi:hypothetical protein